MTATVFAQNPSYIKWRVYESDHFIIYYPEGQEYTAFSALEVAQSVREPLIAMYGDVDSKITITIKDDEDYANGGAYFFDNKIEIYATNLDYQLRSYSDWLWNVVTHELSHVYSMRNSMKATRRFPMAYYQHIDYQDEKREDVLVGYPNVIVSYPIPTFNVPMWLSEGVAQFQAKGARHERWDAHRDMIVRVAADNDQLMSITEMSSFNWTGLKNEMVYNHGYGLTIYIAEKYGDDTLVKLMQALGNPTTVTFNKACKEVLGISEDELYSAWSKHLTEHYAAVKDSLGELVEGKPFRRGGYINEFPSWSPDGTRLAYISNKGMDYGIRVCYVANLTDDGWQWDKKDKTVQKLEQELAELAEDTDDVKKLENARLAAAAAFDIGFAGGIQSRPVWLDNWNVMYNRRMASDRYGSHWWDMYRYTINTDDPREGSENRITENLRGTHPDLAPDKSEIVFVKNDAGQNNLCIMSRKDNKVTAITTYDDGTQFYTLQYSPDGQQILFTIHQHGRVNIGVINRDGSGFRYLVTSPGQDRDACWNSDGSAIVFSSDVTGIPNLYRLTIASGKVEKITNVFGGAYNPAVSPADTTIAFSYYGNGGYEIRTIDYNSGAPVDNNDLFLRPVSYTPDSSYRRFSVEDSKPYTMTTLDFSIMPRVLNDQGNIKLGTYLLKTEPVDRSTFVFGGDISPTNRDTDLFALFEYRKFVPTVFVEMYRQTRSVDKVENYMEEYGTINRKRIFDLNEIDFGLRYRHRDVHMFESRLIYSQYNAKIEYTHFLTGAKVHKPYYTYSRGFDLAMVYRLNRYIRSRDEDINPRGGRKVYFRYDRYFNQFLDEFEYAGFLREKYINYNYDQFYLDWTERIPVPGTRKHTLNLRSQINIIDRYVDSFYELQLGGPRQMRGYTFYSLSGRKTIMAQVLYRFPLVYDIRSKFWLWHFNHIYGGVFADYGRAWNGESKNWSMDGFVKDTGVELRIDAKSFYTFPTMIELSAAYGPDDTWIRAFDEENSVEYWEKDDQDPWKFYFNILFGFN